jgi:hypothetical protein
MDNQKQAVFNIWNLALNYVPCMSSITIMCAALTSFGFWTRSEPLICSAAAFACRQPGSKQKGSVGIVCTAALSGLSGDKGLQLPSLLWHLHGHLQYHQCSYGNGNNVLLALADSRRNLNTEDGPSCRAAHARAMQ